MLSEIYIIPWTSYPSRRVRRMDTLSEYQSVAEDSWLLASDYNFNENDGVSTSAVFNDNPETTDQFSGNYLLVCDKSGNVLSRWFVMRVERTTLWDCNQCQVTLRRDVVADGLSNALNALCFVEKGKITSNSNPLIWNKEDMTLNRIKKSETLIKDESGVQWLVGYVPQDAFSGDEASRTIEAEVADLSSIPDSQKFATWEDCPLYPFFQGKTASLPGSSFIEADFVGLRSDNSTGLGVLNAYVNVEATIGETESGTGFIVGKASSGSGYPAQKDPMFSGFYSKDIPPTSSDVVSKVQSIFSAVVPFTALEKAFDDKGVQEVSSDEMADLLQYAGKTIYIEETEVAYRVGATQSSSRSRIELASSAGTYLKANSKSPSKNDWTDGSFTLSSDETSFQFTETSLSKVKMVLSDASTRPHLMDAPYDMFAIPYGDNPLIFNKTTSMGLKTGFRTDKETAMSVAVAIAKTLGSATVYDVQELPYCPCREWLRWTTQRVVSGTKNGYAVWAPESATKEVNFAYPEGSSTPSAALYWCRSSNFSIDVPIDGYPLFDGGTSVGMDAETKASLSGWNEKSAITNKTENQTDMFRLSSPNMSGAFEFSASANKGVSLFHVDCTYRPFNPYIHVSIDFKGLYGSDFGDARGLVCGGDFSIAQLTSAWADYQQNNKNYQAIFDRQVSNMEVSQKYQRIGDIVSGVSGALSAGAQGASAGSMAGPVGAVAGAVAGTLASGAGAIADWNINEALRKEAIDYKKDLFGYSLGNIQALPYGLAKTSAINANNKRFPFLERYSCTEVEKEALKAKIEADGMSVGVIGSIAEYAPEDGEWNYVKAQLIRVEDSSALTANQFTALAEELYKGIYLRR